MDSNGLLVSNVGFIPYRVDLLSSNDIVLFNLNLSPENTENNNSYRVNEVSGRLSHEFINNKALLQRYKRSNTTTSYCLIFQHDLKKCLQFLPFNQIFINHQTNAKESNNVETTLQYNQSRITGNYVNVSFDSYRDVVTFNDTAITMITIGWHSSHYISHCIDILRKWKGSGICILMSYDANIFIYTNIRVLTSQYRNNDWLNASSHGSKTIRQLPENMMYNIGLDLATTHRVLIMPKDCKLSYFNQNNSRSAENNEDFDINRASIYNSLLQQVSTCNHSLNESVALLMPVYIKSRYTDADGGDLFHSYPNDESWQGKQQPSSLKLDFHAFISQSKLDYNSDISYHDTEVILTYQL